MPGLSKGYTIIKAYSPPVLLWSQDCTVGDFRGAITNLLMFKLLENLKRRLLLGKQNDRTKKL